MIEDFSINDTVQMKKPHACGTNAWRIVRVGADIKIRCLACDRLIMMDRQDFVRAAKKIIARAENGEGNE
ncbi:MAG: DUF951 domain-containing protein [Eubacteriales bacterium]|nr:DUF951 domain-containing protein [Eubacteriales bacterium]